MYTPSDSVYRCYINKFIYLFIYCVICYCMIIYIADGLIGTANSNPPLVDIAAYSL